MRHHRKLAPATGIILGATLVACRSIAAPAQGVEARIDRYLRERPGPSFSGVVLVARGDSVLFERAYGLAEAELGVLLAVSHRFNIGSVTKPVTAAAILRLTSRGDVALGDPFCRFMPRCPDRWRSVSLRHLLSHASGIPDLFGELPAAPADSLRAVVDAAIARHLADSLRSTPGERYVYSNFNYILLGYILEVAGGSPWPEVLEREVFAPAGMSNTEYDDVWSVLPGRARGYELRDGRLRNTRYHDHAAYTAGGLLSTAHDLLRFDQALSTGRLIPDSLVRAMTTPGPGDYGLGWQVIRVFGQRVRNHTGGVTGFASHLAHYDDGTTVILLSNVEDEPAKSTACNVAAVVFGLAPTPRDSGDPPCRPER